MVLGQYGAVLVGTWWYWVSVTWYYRILSGIGLVQRFYACICHCFAHARPIIPRTSTIRKHAGGAGRFELGNYIDYENNLCPDGSNVHSKNMELVYRFPFKCNITLLVDFGRGSDQ